MKTKFLGLVKEVNATGIVATLSNTTNTSELTAAWQKFSEENQELFGKIADWAEEFKTSEPGAIFVEEEALENSMEIAIIIYIINDEDNVSECEIFESYQNLIDAIRGIGDDFATAVADCAVDDFFCNITAENIFNAKESYKGEETETESEEETGDDDAEKEANAEAADADPNYDA